MPDVIAEETPFCSVEAGVSVSRARDYTLLVSLVGLCAVRSLPQTAVVVPVVGVNSRGFCFPFFFLFVTVGCCCLLMLPVVVVGGAVRSIIKTNVT